MPDKSWTLTVSYVNGVASITDGNGGKGDETIFVNETDDVTFQPGAGVTAVNAFSINRPIPLPRGVTVTQRTGGNNCVVTDTNSLVSTAQEVDIAYCIHFTDSNGVARTTDPQLINKPVVRPPGMLMPMGRARSSRPAKKPVASFKYSTPKNARATASPKAKSPAAPAKSAGGKAKPRASK